MDRGCKKGQWVYNSCIGVGINETCSVDDPINTPQIYGGVTALHLAAMSGKVGMVQSLLARGATVDSQTDVGDTPLYEACFEGHKSVVDTLIQNGANHDVSNISDVTCLMIGTYADNADVIKYLVERGVNVNSVDRDGRNVLFYVTSDGQLDTLAYLLDNGACVRRDRNHVTIMMEAVLHGHVDMVHYLIRYDKILGLSPDDVDVMGRNSLFYLVNSDNLRLLEILLEWGVLIAPSNDGRTILMNAALKCNKTLVRYLVTNSHKLGLNLDERDNKDRNCLFYCVTGGDLDLFDFLLDSGIEPSTSDDDVTLLMQAVAKNRADFTLNILQQNGCHVIDVNALDKDGWDALLYAVASGHVHLFRMLIMYGAQCHIANDGRTILMQASAKGDVTFVRYLLDNGNEFQVFGNQRDTDGWNALFYTIQGK
ncbi:hypothetical protein LSH36_95g02008 [Paralvinella palmiformis]|uniref:Ankyrin repeat protein n=1 Tax=Paralvinella palmiformis TaxID=53620 RepID=A0AAD9K0S7_9ANNE|nr:hypothetical protein LSH36_95g02008 [Paralvinella palmiformis]